MIYVTRIKIKTLLVTPTTVTCCTHWLIPYDADNDDDSNDGGGLLCLLDYGLRQVT